LDPSKTNNIVDDDATVVTSNKTKHTTTNALGTTDANTMSFATTHAVADTGATSLFLMEGLKMENVQIATKPLNINLPDGAVVKSTYTCDIIIPGLPLSSLDTLSED
jgi:hypothetical protein